ncbi:MAG: hypothetical protein CJBNEKGG_02310 [Prosthecobacter sp.]|nr:hypothetical protein [Prosthecobacter sp.]
MNRHLHPRTLLPSPRRARLWLLLVWLLSSHGLGPVLMAAAAQATGEHMLKLCSSQHGEMQVVLGHQRCDSQPAVEKEGAAPAGTPVKPDHIIQLRSVEDASAQPRRTTPQQADSPTLVPPAFTPALRPLPDTFTLGFKARHQRTPAWSAGPHVRASRTVILC